MKHVALLALLMTLGVFTVGCEKKKETPAATPAAAPAGEPAGGAAPAEEPKKE